MHHTLIRTGDVEWRPFADIPGFMEKPLWFDLESGARRTIWHVPPAWGETLIPDEAMLHYHRSVYERSYFLFGDFPHWEFDGFDDLDGYVEIMREGLFMDRPPMSLHGLKPGLYSQTGAVILYWNTGRGTSIAEEGYSTESVDVLASRRDPEMRAALNPVRLLRPHEMPWQDFPGRQGWKIKQLADEAQGGDPVTMVFVPPGEHPLGDGVKGDGTFARPWAYLLSGDMRIGMASGIELCGQAGDYLDWEAGAGPCSYVRAGATGCLALCIGHTL